MPVILCDNAMEVLVLWRRGGREAVVVLLKENRIADLSFYGASGGNRRGPFEGRVASQTCSSFGASLSVLMSVWTHRQ